MTKISSSTWDAIVIGGGHNGLVCAAYLAKGASAYLYWNAGTWSVARR